MLDKNYLKKLVSTSLQFGLLKEAIRLAADGFFCLMLKNRDGIFYWKKNQ